MVLENKGSKKPNSLRIITNDYTHKVFFLSNFMKKDWLMIESLLREKGVEVDNLLYIKTSKNILFRENHA